MSVSEIAAALDWESIANALDADGYAVTEPLLPTALCNSISTLYDNPDTAFRSTINMARYNFGSGEYRYFAYPLPAVVRELRESLFPPLAEIANTWAEKLHTGAHWPDSLGAFTAACHEAGQARPTPLMLRYRAGDFNCLHQDLYGDLYFPLQVIFMLGDPGSDFAGGELVLVEQRPRMQSKASVVALAQGAAAIIPVRERPRRGTRGFHRVQMRHGVSRVTSGERNTLGMIFHDAR